MDQLNSGAMRRQTYYWLLVWFMVTSCLMVVAQVPRTYNMDELYTCGRTITVDDTGVRLYGRGNVAPSNPPLECIVYLQSAYAMDDGSNLLQIKVESLFIKDCTVRLDLYNGRRSVGLTLQAFSCQNSPVGIVRSKGREVTVRFSRPDRLVHNEYQFSLEIKPYKNHDAPGTKTSVGTLSVGAIIGIIIGCLVLVGLIILAVWCCCTGRLGNFNIPGRSVTKASDTGVDNAGAIIEKPKSVGAIDFQNPAVWNTVTTGNYEPPQQNALRLYQKGVPRNNLMIGRRFEHARDGEYQNYPARESVNRRSTHEYEQYSYEQRQRDAEERRNRATSPRKETLIDDVFESDSETVDSKPTNQAPGSPNGSHKGSQNASPKRSPQGSPKGSPKASPKAEKKNIEIPKEEDMESESVDLQSQLEDDSGSPRGSRKKAKGETSPKSKRKQDDPTAMPPETFEPIFTAPISGIDYKVSQDLYGAPQGYQGGFIPYGLIPAGAFAPGPPGSQTYAYAYQTVPVAGVPGQPYSQGAWFVQNTPTSEGNRRTAFAVEETRSPDKSRQLTPDSQRRKHKQGDPFQRTPHRDSDRSRRSRNRYGDDGLDLSIIARGAAPPDPDQAHRSVAMKSGTDPDTGIHTTQVLWTDTVTDPTDPGPDDNPQITRRNITRVTTKSGHGELPPQTALLSLEEEEPALLSPSSKPSHSATIPNSSILPAAQTPDGDNVAFYTGDAVYHQVLPPERTSTPTSIHRAPAYSHAIRDRIPLDDSTV